ncbi:DUF1190 domain-containing protein [Rhizobium sp. G187]|uniref:DUF1190 domain-containing protein n=1 Tax=Rhizobium sp. G187 TaxID=3451352 RepID=UPI003EE43EFB
MRRRLIGDHPYLALGTIAATAFVLSTCSGDEAVVFSSADQCLTSDMDPEVCRAAAADAMQAHLAAGPRYRNMPACEMDYGPRKCAEHAGSTVPNNPDGKSVFIPKLAGFVLSSGIDDIEDYRRFRSRQEEEGSSHGATAIYVNRWGEMVTPVVDKRGGGRSLTVPGPLSVQSFNPRTHATGRGGFGGRLFSGG